MVVTYRVEIGYQDSEDYAICQSSGDVDFINRSEAQAAFNRQREAVLEEYRDGEYFRTISQSVDAPNLDHNLMR